MSDTPRHRKVCVLHLAQCIELALKAALVENNVSIYEKGGSRTLAPHDALQKLGQLWEPGRSLEGQARVELLIDERNAIQHRYGSVDDVTLDYHMETTFDIMRAILKKEFDTDLDAWIRDNIGKNLWEKVRFVEPDMPSSNAPSGAALPQRSGVRDFIDGFARFESSVLEYLKAFLEPGQRFRGSTLDFILKTLSNVDPAPQDLIQRVPAVYRLRNRGVYGEEVLKDDEVADVLPVLDGVLVALQAAPVEVIRPALRAAQMGIRGTDLTSVPNNDDAEPDAILP